MSKDELILVQYEQPSKWIEWGVVFFAMLMVGCTTVYGGPYFAVALAAGLLFWNYRLFRVVNEYVKYRNASEFSRLLDTIAALERNNTEDGTIPVQESLTKEQEDVTKDPQDSE